MTDKNSRVRLAVQAVAALAQNANIKGFLTGKIYRGSLKSVCVPGLNCYSCPGALGACPIGSLQSFLSARKFRLPFYVCGLLIFFGVLLGRAVCGFLCPFGLLQDLLYKIPFFKKINTFRGDRPLRYLKYLVLAVFVVALPLAFRSLPAFCKYICPSGTASGILLTVADSRLVSALGGRFALKCSILAATVISALALYRPFCKYLCPLGALYSFFNKVSFFRLSLDTSKCVSCGKCAEACRMGVDPVKAPDDIECIRCGRCADKCPAGALSLTVSVRSGKPKEAEKES